MKYPLPPTKRIARIGNLVAERDELRALVTTLEEALNDAHNDLWEANNRHA